MQEFKFSFSSKNLYKLGFVQSYRSLGRATLNDVEKLKRGFRKNAPSFVVVTDIIFR